MVLFEIYGNKRKLGAGKTSSKNWSRLAAFTGKFTSIKVDYLIIK